jgi:MazG family protein
MPTPGERFDELVRIMATLRGPQGCPWDREQTLASLRPFLLEETYEALEALDRGDLESLREELGDLLFEIVFLARIAEEGGHFSAGDAAADVGAKLVRRHPHVFGDVEVAGPDEVVRNWEQIKKAEKGRSSIMDGLPGDLPSLLYAHKVQRKAASVGFDWDDVNGALPKVDEELDELREAIATAVEGDIEAELGDLLFAVVNVARHLDVDPETALRGASAKFRSRFQAVEAQAEASGRDLSSMTLAELDALWDQAKR